MSRSPRREQRPDPVADTKSVARGSVPVDDPNYHYRIVSLEQETQERVDYHRDRGYGVAKQTNRFAVMGCPRDEYERRQRESLERADRLREHSLPPEGDMVRDETSIEVTRGLGATEDDD
ncbi:MAG TPA: hypothetical protein VNI20_09725 [Fimbriimonadaceae bacterium]|nr:hypothetical protein [Fimbriimonadaceae bacterium]